MTEKKIIAVLGATGAQHTKSSCVTAEEDALKLVTCNYRKPGLSPREFQRYWKDKHGPLVLRNFAALRADEANFLDPTRFRFMLVRDRIFR
jgi:hypothetical protein